MSSAKTNNVVENKATQKEKDSKKATKNTFLLGQVKTNLKTLGGFVNSIDTTLKSSNGVSRDISWALSRMAFIIQNFYQSRNIVVSLATPKTMPIYEVISKMQRKKEQLKLKDSDENKIKIAEIEKIEKELSDIALKALDSDLLS